MASFVKGVAMPLHCIRSGSQKAACKGREMQVKKEVPAEVAHFSRSLTRAAQQLGRFERQKLGHFTCYFCGR